MPKHDYPLHHTDAEPLYVTIPQEEYDRLCKVDKEWKETVEAFQKSVGPMIPYYPDKFCPRCGKRLDEKKWRKVGEELPEEYKEILFIDAYKNYYLGSMFTIPHYDGTPIEQYWSGRGEPRSTNVTHWMPLPEPPKEDA